jgi:acyl carrier protein
VGGEGVALGYLNRPELTAERFVPDPFSGRPGARMFRTGDLARWRADGDIEYLGRLDDQVKIRGFRIELTEVRGALLEHPSIREAVVVAREDTPGEKRLVAYLVGSERGHVPTAELRSFLLGRLPGYMVPSAFVRMEALPLLSNGKVDYSALKAPGFSERNEAYVAPRNEIEEELAKIWSTVLRIEHIGVESSFFELGGHSLMATRVASRILEAFQVEVPLHRFFEAPTIAELALIIIQSSLEEEGTGDAARMLEELEQLSPEEARALLEQDPCGE